MKYYIIAGEASGDLHASNLMREIYALDAQAEIRFWGGNMMLSVGGELVRHYKDTAVMGVADVLTSLGKIRKNFALCRRDLAEYHPDALILVDYPGFNLPMAGYAHKLGLTVFYYISPKVWASKEYRIKKMRRYIDRLFTILPFETEYFRRHGMEVTYCGNPVMDAIEARHHKGETLQEFCLRNNLDGRPKIALLAGSRKGEIRYCLPPMLRAIDEFPQYQFVIAGAPSFTMADYEPYVQGKDVRVVFGETYQLVSVAQAALVTSGTATLETAILNCPQILIYLMWGGAFSDRIARRIIKVKWIGLVNLILGRESLCEMFQSAYSFERMIALLRKLVDAGSPERQRMLADYDELRRLVGTAGCSRRAAQGMVDILNK